MVASPSTKKDTRKRHLDLGLILGALASLMVLGALILIVNWPTKISSHETEASTPSSAKRAADTSPAPTSANRNWP